MAVAVGDEFPLGVRNPAPIGAPLLAQARDIDVLTRFPWLLAPEAATVLAMLAINPDYS